MMVNVVVEAENLGMDFRSLNFSSLYYADAINFTRTRYEFFHSNGAYDEFRGRGFEYNGDGEPTAGTVSQYRAYAPGILMTAVDLNVAATGIRDAARTFSTSDDLRLIRDALAGDDTFDGGGGAIA